MHIILHLYKKKIFLNSWMCSVLHKKHCVYFICQKMNDKVWTSTNTNTKLYFWILISLLQICFYRHDYCLKYHTISQASFIQQRICRSFPQRAHVILRIKSCNLNLYTCVSFWQFPNPMLWICIWIFWGQFRFFSFFFSLLQP